MAGPVDQLDDENVDQVNYFTMKGIPHSGLTLECLLCGIFSIYLDEAIAFVAGGSDCPSS